MQNQYGIKKLENINGYKKPHLNGNEGENIEHQHENGKNGYNIYNDNNINEYVVITEKQKQKHRINISSIKSYRTTAKKETICVEISKCFMYPFKSITIRS